MVILESGDPTRLHGVIRYFVLSTPEVDLKLFALSMLLTSQFIFNTIGLISDESLTDLSIMQMLTSEIRLETISNDEDEEDQINQ